MFFQHRGGSSPAEVYDYDFRSY